MIFIAEIQWKDVSLNHSQRIKVYFFALSLYIDIHVASLLCNFGRDAFMFTTCARNDGNIPATPSKKKDPAKTFKPNVLTIKFLILTFN